MENFKKVSLTAFEEVAKNNGYEVFTPEEVAEFFRDGLMKSRENKFSQEERDEFVTDLIFLQKAVCSDEAGNDVTRYYRKEQVVWDEDPKGELLKSERTGRYADTAENRRLHRVGQPYAKREGGLQKKEDGEKDKSGKDTEKDALAYDVAANKRAVESALGKLSWRDEDGDEMVAEGGEDGSNSKLGDYSVSVDKKDGKVTVYDLAEDKQVMSGYATNGVWAKKFKALFE